MSDDLDDFIHSELERLGTLLASQRMSAGDTRLWAIALLTETAYCLRAVRAASIMRECDIVTLLADAADVIFSDPEHPVRVVQGSAGSAKEGKPN
jgi:hypothetical protein